MRAAELYHQTRDTLVDHVAVCADTAVVIHLYTGHYYLSIVTYSMHN